MTLNPAQQGVVDSKAKVRVALAGPGSGKTRTMGEAVKGSSGLIAVMTFTNAGADELRERLLNPDLHPWQQAIFEGRKIVHLGTLHAYCFKLVQRFGGWIGYIAGKVTILPEDERLPRLLAARKKHGFDLSEKVILARKPTGDRRVDQAVELVWNEYRFELKRANVVDFDLILEEALELLRLPEVRSQVRLDHLFVDEAQDSAEIDWQIYDAIPAKRKMFVGDSDQSIFGFRGAWPRGLFNVASAGTWSDTQVETHKLELNYRSDVDICNAANSLISHNTERLYKMIVPVSRELGDVGVHGFEDVGQELAWLASSIRGLQTRSVAVLARTHGIVEICRDHLLAMGLPVQRRTFGPQRPADWAKAKLLIGLAIAPNEILVDRYLRLELGAKEVERLKLESQANGGRLITAARITVPDFQTLATVMPFLIMNGVSESTARAIRARAELMPHGADLTDLLHELHSKEEPKEEEPDGIYCGTVHSAKGREWDVVFLPAFEQGIFPHTRMADGEETAPVAFPSNLQEERRLAFVAVTRARHELYVSHVEYRRSQWGRIGGAPSQFIKEMDAVHVEGT